ncbi:bud neck involved protein [Mortierella sp. AD011]|nr:bud neck involved protein [Mortierella sp. AD010]KAF9381733.1 bud neck involved protein [Mortierella sp. AD011]
MYRSEQGSTVQGTFTAFSQLMAESAISDKTTPMQPLLTINPPASTSIPESTFFPPSILSFSEKSVPSEVCSPDVLWSKPSPSPSSSMTSSTAVEQSPFLISQPVMPMSVVPAAVMGIKSTSCISLGAGNNATSTSAGLHPLVGRDYMGKVTEESSRPLSSMEYAESWLPALTFSTEAVDEKLWSSFFSKNDADQVSIRVPRTSTDRQSIHPLEMDPNRDVNTFQDHGHSFKEPALASAPTEQPVIRKKTSFAERIRNAFTGRRSSSKSVETQEDTVSLSLSSESDKAKAHLSVNQELHRGSVSSNSSVDDTALGHSELRRDSKLTATPLTSPDASPPASPSIKPIPTLTAGQSNSESPLICPVLALDAETATGGDSSELLPNNQAAVQPNKQTGIQPTPTRTIKKRLSFGSISSFFGSRSPEERRANQQRSSSLPHIESPLAIVGRQIAGFQRRHSFNDLDDNSAKTKSQSIHQPVSPSLVKDSTSTPFSTSAPTADLPPTPAKKLSLNSVFSKKPKEKKNAPKPIPPTPKSTPPTPMPTPPTPMPTPPTPTPTKPLKSALVHRPPASSPAKIHHVRRRSASTRSQGSSHRRQVQMQYRQNRHHPQRQSQDSHGPSDPLARLAEANQALALLSIGSSDNDFSTSQTQETSAGGLYREDIHSSSQFSTDVTPSVPRSPSAPLNPLAALSRSSSCCSLSSSSGDMSVPQSASSVSDDGISCYSTSVYSQSRDQIASNGEDSMAFHPILPTSAARISVARIAVEAQVKLLADIQMEDESSSSTASSPRIMGYDHQQSNYQDPKHQQQLMILDQQPFEDEYYAEDHNEQEHNLFVDANSQQNYHYQPYYYEDSYRYPPRPRRQLQFSTEEPIIHPTWTSDQYDRTSDMNITACRLTPAVAQKIKLELNKFKSQEMEVHENSRMYTHFFI